MTSTTQWEGSVHSQAEQGTVVPKDPLCRYVGTGVMPHEVLHSSSSLWTLVGLELDTDCSQEDYLDGSFG